MKVLITGISGFAGGFLVEELLSDPNKKIELYGTYINEKELVNTGFKKNKARLVKCDITNRDEVDQVVGEIKPDQIYHLAGIASPAFADREKVLAVNVEGTLNILRAAQKLKKKIKILLASTGYVYGSSENQQPFTEESETKAIGVYAESKLTMEKQALGLPADNVEIVISRSFNHIGSRQTPDFVVPAFAKQIAEIEKEINPPVMYVGNLEATRDFLDVVDVSRAYRLLMEKGGTEEIYNVASGQAVKISAILDKLLTLSTKEISIEQDQNRLRPSDLAYSVGSYAKIKKELGWQPTISLDKTLRIVLDYWRGETASSSKNI